MILQPDFSLKINNTSIPLIHERLVNLQLIDKSGVEADELTITLSDADENINIPTFNATLELAIGYIGSPLTHKGTFIVNEVSYSINPNQLSITARSVAIDGLKTQKSRSFESTSLGSILTTIADESTLTAMVNSVLSDISIDHIDQTTESNAAFMTRLADHYDALITIKNGNLIATAKGSSITASGVSLPTTILTRSDIDTLNYQKNKQQYSGVKAAWNEKKHAKRYYEEVGDDTAEIKTLNKTYSNATQASIATRSELNKLTRTSQSLNMTLNKGWPTLIPEMLITTSQVKNSIDEQKWLINEVTHSIGSGGYKTDLTLELY